jgi:hypothetical protein
VTAVTIGTCSADVAVTATDASGNSTTVHYSTRIDNIPPVISAVAASEIQPNVVGAVDVKNCGSNTVQGTVTITVTATDNCSLVNGHPSVALTNGPASDTAICIATNGNQFTYTWTVTAGTADGTWTATVLAQDLCNTTLSNFTLCVDNSQVTGLVQLEFFYGSGTVPPNTRTVTLVATGGPATNNVVKTWVLPLNFNQSSGPPFQDVASFTLTGIPAGTTGLSAKTAWNLRSKLPVTLVGGQATGLNFTGAKLLRGADLTGDNIVNFLDYSTLGINLFTTNPVADIDGNGQVDLDDYNLLYLNWFTGGDPQ